MKPAVTVYPAYFGNPDTGERSEYVYVADWEGLVKPDQLKRYTVYFQSSHYFDIDQDRVIDFNAVIQGLRDEAVTLRWIAEEKLPWYKEESDKQRNELGSVRPGGVNHIPPPSGVTRAKDLTSALGRLFRKRKK